MTKKRTKKTPQSVFVYVWQDHSDDPVVFVGKTRESADAQVYKSLIEVYRDVVGEEIPKDHYKAIQKYFEACSDKDFQEWLLQTKEEVL
jgi:hypothetical protein